MWAIPAGRALAFTTSQASARAAMAVLARNLVDDPEGSEEGTGPIASFPDFPTAHTGGADLNEATGEAIDCFGGSIAFAMADKTADKANVPKPSRLKRGLKLAPVPLWL